MKEIGKLAIFVGIDGSGKSTLINGLEQSGYKVTHWRRLREVCPNLNFTTPAETVQKLDGAERLAFILNYIQSEWRYLIQPFRKNGTDVISDGFFARFYAKEKIYQRLNLNHLRKHCPLKGNELFLMIDTPAQVSLERRGTESPSPYEYLREPNDFISFQERQREELKRFIGSYNYFVLDGNKSKDELLNESRNLLRDNGILAKKE